MMRGWIAASVLMIAACGPIEYVGQVTRRASSDVEDARAVAADKYAPYYYTLAVEYLRKARHEAAHADYQAASRFGRKASEAARKAKTVAQDIAADPDRSGPLAPLGGDDK
jgi:hypothetical protein